MAKYVLTLTWAWVIILGGLMLTPDGIVCIVCGVTLTKVIGLISVVLGVAAFVVSRGAMRG